MKFLYFLIKQDLNKLWVPAVEWEEDTILA